MYDTWNFHLKIFLFRKLVEDEPEVYNIYWRTEQKCRKITKLMYYINFLNFVYLPLPVLYSIYDMIKGNFDTSAWILPFYVSVPFNTDTIWGWVLLVFININIGFGYSLGLVALTSYFISCCFYISAICEHFEFIIESTVKSSVAKNQNEKDRFEYKKREWEIKKHLCKAINTHMNMYE